MSNPNIPPGWSALSRRLIANIEALAAGRPYRIEWMGEKYGSLRCDASVPDDVRPLADEIISLAEEASLRICSVCGAAGKMRGDEDGWMYVACDEHTRPADR
ncbi:MAG: hypothetical protein RJA99_3162 [Pseudomonadota bacterium]|jgi:hypothetical protein